MRLYRPFIQISLIDKKWHIKNHYPNLIRPNKISQHNLTLTNKFAVEILLINDVAVIAHANDAVAT